jgi:DNA-binding FrmR family transcriptional regulator
VSNPSEREQTQWIDLNDHWITLQYIEAQARTLQSLVDEHLSASDIVSQILDVTRALRTIAAEMLDERLAQQPSPHNLTAA